MRKIYINGQVYTGSLPLCEAFVTEAEHFIYAGSNSLAMTYAGKDTEIVDLKNRFVCAGFNDSHMHVLGFGQTLINAPLAEHTGSLSDVLDCLRNHQGRTGGWLTGRGWNQDYFNDVHRMPDRYDLDSVSTDIPIAVSRACGHCMAVNSKALELCGITADTAAPEGGAIGMRDGKPDGLFYDNAMTLIQSHIPQPSEEEIMDMLRAAFRALNSYGITSAQTDDYCTFRQIPWQTINDAYRRLKEAGEMTVRINEQCNFQDLDTLKEFISAGNNTGTGDLLFKTGPLKMLGDGSLGGRTAHLSRPYADDPDTSGFNLYSDELMNSMIEYANDHHMQCAVHAIGDACLDQVLNAIDRALRKTPVKDHRHGIIHCQISRKDQLERMADLDLHIYCQSIFLDYDNHIVRQRTGELADTSYSWKTLMNSGLSVSNGSDCPVELPDVMAGIQCAVTRTSLHDQCGPYLPEEAFTVQEALDSFTVRGAEASFEESVKGQIRAGYLADFAVLEADPFQTDPSHLKDIRVLETYLGGQLVYRREN